MITNRQRLRAEYGSKNIALRVPSFSQLTNLEYLNLNKNLNLDLPNVVVSLSMLSRLKELLLSECLITALPLDIGKITSLKKLDLKGNRLTEIPLTFGNLSNLEY